MTRDREPDPERIASILKAREKIIPLLSFSGPGLMDAVERLTKEQIAGRETLERVRKFLEPYEISLHANFRDMRDHPEQLLLRQGGCIQFSRDSSPADYQVFVSMEPQIPSLLSIIGFGKPKPELLQAVTFCHAPTQRSSELLTVFMSTDKSTPISAVYPADPKPQMRNIPQTDSYTISLVFDQGRIKHILYRYVEGMHYEELWYELTNQQVVVRKGSPGSLSHQMHAITYLLSSDGKLRREFYTKNVGTTTNEQGTTLEEEIEALFARLPFENYHLPIPDEA